jgi:hypothetical protein
MPFGPEDTRIKTQYCTTVQRHKTNKPNFQSRNIKYPTHNFGSKEQCAPVKHRAENDHEEGLLRPKKGRSRGGVETRKDANNMRHMEGEVKERETGSEAYGRYITDL